MRPQSPCKDCPKRKPACHDSCNDYIAYKQECVRTNEQIRISKLIQCESKSDWYGRRH
jgi:hypothetical protein